ncbi:branched-chain amino acid aminotransferase [Microbulbifer thermotolerans]|uniref:Branched-chain-amino-acid aminotransferase n=1 Tax=Microbulbifer thermotolerans TaxID=252514 RepID=A0A143HJ01_MICTH|nr:branched-chain amino acid aminotransferase [Microbulbifer thermotolerans]AMX01695.1 branched chain amino acid aminotransferase [Microbulbifer thermotolerans]MCX2779465.1 branched-chain amino acid aminotransferase [Microbulbifer thermotolerans]MCX2784023.1 branched-chain amino acid aminotransferase [Microbulbifer thermotolerans]MCX2793336.1 branched-chain amino acid aminotransferase [Microbulbifer thermotolerans]MCX2801274.1 branched-chain amino acid aminotransferase [Microbulbifer thermotol
MSIYIDPAVAASLRGFEMPEKLGFGTVMAPVMFRAVCQDGCWSQGELVPYAPLALDPAAKVLHYAQSCFEGMKAYRTQAGGVSLFRPERNAARMAHSAARLCMPPVPEALFMDGVRTVTAYCANLVPATSGESLYLRPFLFGTQADLSVSASTSYEFYVIASPSEAYHAGNMRLWVEREDSRAALGGTGDAKVGGNYAASLRSVARLKERGYDQSLWLNPGNRNTVDELSGMNFFAVINGELHTPALSGSILEGVTRDSLIDLARDMGYTVHERAIDIDELLGQVAEGSCDEAFACGTAAIVSPISLFGDGGREYPLAKAPGPVAERLRQMLLDIQEGRAEDKFGWMHPVEVVSID